MIAKAGITDLDNMDAVKGIHAKEAWHYGAMINADAQELFISSIGKAAGDITVGYGAFDKNIPTYTGISGGKGYFIVNTNYDLIKETEDTVARDSGFPDSASATVASEYYKKYDDLGMAVVQGERARVYHDIARCMTS